MYNKYIKLDYHNIWQDTQIIGLTFLASPKIAERGVSDTTCAQALYSIDLKIDVGLNQEK